MKNTFYKFSKYLIVTFTLLWPRSTLAQAVNVTTDLGSTTNFSEFLTQFFAWALPITSATAVLVLIYAGYLYMTSQGNQENITTAKELITGVVLGILLLFTARILLRNVIGTI
jgi:TRAP-type C4-dicarboxylate transport system permease small subunit